MKESEPDEGRLLTDEELTDAVWRLCSRWDETVIANYTVALKAQLAKDQLHEQTRVERIKREIEFHSSVAVKRGIDDKIRRVRVLTYLEEDWQEFWKKELK